MPVADAHPVHAFLQRAFRGRHGEPGIFSRKELGSLMRMLENTDDPSYVEVLVTEFRAALESGSLALDPLRRRRIDELFGMLAQDGRLPDHLSTPVDDEDWVDVLLMDDDPVVTPQPEPQPTPQPEPQPQPLPEPSFLTLGELGGAPLSVSGTLLQLGDDLLDLSQPHRTGVALRIFWGALRAGWTDTLSDDARAALASAITGGFIGTGFDIPISGDGKLVQGGATAAAALLLSRLGLSERARSVLGELAANDPRPFLQTILHDALGKSDRSPEEAEAFRARIAWATSETPRAEAGWRHVDLGFQDAATVWCGMTFCRTDEAIGRLVEQIGTFAVALGEGTVTFEPAESQAMLEALQSYIDDSETQVFQFGLWRSTAAVSASNLTHAAAVAGWVGEEGTIRAIPPHIEGVVLDASQVEWIEQHIGLVRNAAAATAFAEALQVAHDLVPHAEGDVLCGTSFAQFKRAHEVPAQKADAEEDGRSDYSGFARVLRHNTQTLSTQITTVLQGLTADAPVAAHPLDETRSVTIPPSSVAWFTDIVREHLGSARSLPNLIEAMQPFATDGVLDEEGAIAYRAFLDGYFAEWPHLDVFDFNKLERMAYAKVSGNTKPLCQINGQMVNPGVFHVKVGESVKAAMQHVAFPFRWIPHRFGYRAKQAAELIDLLAERARQDKGPVATLRKSFPGRPIYVVATTSDLEYNSLIFKVEHEGEIEIYYLDSEGGVHLHARHPEAKHVLFEAEVDSEGHVHVRHPEQLPISPRAYPLMNTYGKGDRIDVEYYDTSKSIQLKAQERFETRYTVRRATITSYDDRGNHVVQIEADEGSVERTVDYNDLRDWNNPHVVSETNGVACTCRFRSGSDEHLAKDLVDMEKIAHEHGLPEFDLALSEVALAKVQKQFLRALNAFTHSTLKYPRKPPVDDNDQTYHDRLATGTHDMGDYLKIQRGVCRHQFVREHMGKQRGGIDERFASGAANTYTGTFRGLHIWGEVSLADRSRLGVENVEPTDTRYLSDATWSDPYVPLWEGAYGNDMRRIEMYDRTDYYSYLLARSS